MATAPTYSAEHPTTGDRGAGMAAVIVAVTGFSWGFILVKVIDLAAPTLAFWRLLIGASSLAVAALILRVPFPAMKPPLIVAGCAFAAHQLLFITASQSTSIAIVTLIAAVQPLLVAFVSHRLVGERVAPALWGCALLALTGVAVVVHANLNDASRSGTGDILAVFNLIAFTTYFLACKRARASGVPTLSFTATVLGISCMLITPVMLWTGPREPSSSQWMLLAVLALVTGNGHLFLNWAHPRVSAALSSLILAAVPLLAALWARLVLGEPYGWRHLAGMLLVAVAIEVGRRVEFGRW